MFFEEIFHAFLFYKYPINIPFNMPYLSFDARYWASDANLIYVDGQYFSSIF